MKTFYIKLLLLLSTTIYAQKYKQFYVTHENDTIECKIIGHSNKRVNIIENGKRKSLTPKHIKSFSSLNMEKYRTFTILKNDQKNFYGEYILGPLSFYNVYTANRHSGILPVMVKNDKIVYLNVLNPRKRIAELISDCPTLYKEWTETERYKTSSDKELIVLLYNECKK